ncbi:MAG: hypothetical protein V1855_04280 [bacterium]
MKKGLILLFSFVFFPLMMLKPAGKVPTVGLPNKANSCYLNSTLQMVRVALKDVFNNDELWAFLSDKANEEKIRAAFSGQATCQHLKYEFVKNLFLLQRNYLLANRDGLSSLYDAFQKSFFDVVYAKAQEDLDRRTKACTDSDKTLALNPQFIKGRHSDACEALTFVCDILEECMNCAKTHTIINEDFKTLFYGMQKESFICQKCSHEMPIGRQNPFSLLKFRLTTAVKAGEKAKSDDIVLFDGSRLCCSKSLERCFSDYAFATDTINDKKCEKCQHDKTKQKVTLSQFGQKGIFLSLNRYYNNGSTLQKLSHDVALSTEIGLEGKQHEPYELRAVIFHSGSTCGGHYTCCTKENNDQWYMCNDTYISEMDDDEVDTMIDLGKVSNGNAHAYVLYFERVKPAPTVLGTIGGFLSKIFRPVQELFCGTNSDVFGLVNLGNTCYLNVVLQGLLGCGDFVQFLAHNKGSFGEDEKLLTLLLDLSDQLQQEKGAATPKLFYDEFIRQGGGLFSVSVQEDASSVLDFLLEKIAVFCTKKKLRNPFKRDVQKRTTCCSCLCPFDQTISEQSVLGLNLVNKTWDRQESTLSTHCFTRLDACLSDYFFEHISKKCTVNQICEFRDKDGVSSTEITITEPCKYLTIQLRRFIQVSGEKNNKFKSKKLEHDVEIPKSLDISKYCECNRIKSTIDNSVAQYDLVTIAFHRGSLHGGHYFVVRKFADGTWRLCDDATVTTLTQEQVEPVLATGRYNGAQAYVLFFELRENPRK